MKHDCRATNERLVDLLFGEVEAGREASVLEEVGRCDECLSRYRSMAETLHLFDIATEATIPAEEFWPGYEERFKKRMAQEIRQDLWQQAAFPFARGEYKLTFLEQEGLTRRLTRELRNVGHDAELTWPQFKRDPLGFTGRTVGAYTRAAWGFFSQRNVALATVSSFVLLTLLLGSVFALERLHASRIASVNPNENLELVGFVEENEIPKEQEKPDKGAAGTNEGKGGGSKPKQEKSGGGGGGGRQEALPVSFGKPAPGSMQDQILPPSAHAPVNKTPLLPVAQTIKADEMLMPAIPDAIPYGDMKSSSTTPSDGSGKGGGQGTGTGTGQGPGDGKGYGPGHGENVGGGDAHYGGGGPGGGGGGAPVDYGRPFKINEVSQRALITFKPEPGFTEDARKNNVTGLVRLRAVLSSSGAVTNVSVIKGLPDGLTEKAISAARQIKFRPAQKDGHTVSQYIVLEYNFNIY